MVLPLRTTLRRKRVPAGLERTASSSSNSVRTGVPSIAVIRSPGFSVPTAGEPAVIPMTWTPAPVSVTAMPLARAAAAAARTRLSSNIRSWKAIDPTSAVVTIARCGRNISTMSTRAVCWSARTVVSR